MRTTPHTRRLLLARRLAAGLPPWAVAKGSNLPAEAMEGLLVEQGFAELIGSMAELMAMDEEARLAKLFRLADQIIIGALQRLDLNAALFMRREQKLGRKPGRTLARGLNRTIEQEMARAGRLQAEIDAGKLTPSMPAPEPAAPPAAEPAAGPGTLQAAAAAVAAAAAMRPDRHLHPVDALIWRKAGSLRREVLDEQLLHHAVAEKAAAERRKVPLELEEVEAIEAGQVAAAAARMAAPRPEPKAPSPQSTAQPAEPELSPEDLQALQEIRAMYRRLPPERLAGICKRPPRGMERLFAVLAREIGIGAAWPKGP
jgi:hypothetical protein